MTFNLFGRPSILLLFLGLNLLCFTACKEKTDAEVESITIVPVSGEGVSLVILGTTQDAGSPQIGCEKSCCEQLFKKPDHTRKVVSLGLIDKKADKTFLFEATPDIKDQIHLLNTIAQMPLGKMPDGLFLTHAHMGHYSGLLSLGKEAINAGRVPTYAMPRMTSFLKTQGPWDQLVSQENIALKSIHSDSVFNITPTIKILPVLVPHRDEYSETVGYKISGPQKSALFIPDIDKWERWDQDLTKLLEEVDYAFVDATFYDGVEMNMRDISEIPHPFVIETMKLLEHTSESLKKKIYFIHLNHTNPLLDPKSEAYRTVVSQGFRVARFNQVFEL